VNRLFELVLKAISYAQPEVRKSYKLQRLIGHAGKGSLIKHLERSEDIKVASEDYQVPVRIFSSKRHTEPKGLIIYYHGGGWVVGDIDSYNSVCATIVMMTGYTVASVDYRLAPEHKYPTPLLDSYNVMQHILENCEKDFGVKKEQVVIMGDSAGGNLAAAISQMARDKGTEMPRRQILLYPATNNNHTLTSEYQSVRDNGTNYVLTSERVEEYMDLYQSKPEDRNEPYFSPITAENFSNQPKTLIVTAELDPLRDEGEDYGMKLKKAGNHVEIHRILGALHGFFSGTIGSSKVRKCYKYIISFLSEGI